MTENGENGNGVVITNKDLYVLLRKLEDSVNAMTPQATTLGDHEKRLRALERWRYAVPTTIIVAAAGVAVAIVEKK